MNTEQTAVPQTRQVEVTVVFDKNYHATERIIVNIGGSRSSKSYSIAQLMVKKFNEERDKNLLTTRKTLPALRTTAYRVAVNMMKDYGCYQHFIHNKSERTIYNPYKNNLWIFTSIDDPEKIKSTEYNYIHMEEANEFTYDDYMILKLMMSGKESPGERNQMYISLNPSEKYGWINDKLLPQRDVKVIHSTYLDAIKFLPPSYVEWLEGLKDEDASYWHVYGLGLFAEIKGIIHKLHIIPSLPKEPKETIYGLDFGFVNPNALLQIDIDMENMSLYLTELLYQTGMTNADLKEKLKEKIPKEHRGREIYADGAEPARIEEIGLEGFNIHKASKSVVDGIDCVNRFTLYSTDESPNVNSEVRGYKRKVDRNGVVLEEPVKFKDHFPNTLRYGAYTHLWERLIDTEPDWTVHAGMKEEEKPPEEKKPLRASVSDERKAPDPVVHVTSQGKKPKDTVKPEPDRKEREDSDWAV